jgi:hypothetical protein
LVATTYLFRRRYGVFVWLWGLYLAFASGPLGAADLRCAGCGEKITSSYITAMSKKWHPEHFVCTSCGEAFGDEGYVEHQHEPWCTSCYHREHSPRCAGCGEPIKGQYVTASDQKWHPEHFVCTSCGVGLAGKEHAEHAGEALCVSCYRRDHTPQCGVCQQPVSRTYLTNYWQEPYCQRHKDEMPACFSCNRLISQNLTGGGVRLGDGRTVCNLCRQTAVDRAEDGAAIATQVRQALAAAGFSLDGVKIPVRLVGQKELGNTHGRQTAGKAKTILHTIDGKVVRREVEEIMVLYGLPAEHYAAILAHEYGHAWVFLQKFPPLSPALKEGLAELFSYLWLSGRQEDRAAYRIHLKNNNEDRIYGGGFRAALAALDNRTPAELLEYVRMHAKLPR